MRILVTGATGFIGGYLSHQLVSQGHNVRALVRRFSPSLSENGIELTQGDITDPELVLKAVTGTTDIFHLAAQRDEWGTPDSAFLQVNVEGTRHLLEAASKVGVKRFVYCSSVGVARHPGNIEADEALPYVEASSQVAYHRTKTLAEQEVLEAAHSGKVQALVVRPVITYGPGDQTGMVTQLLDRLARGRFLPVGNGRNHVDLAFVDVIVTGMVLAWQRGTVGQVYILSGPRPYLMREVLEAAYRVLEKNGPGPIYVPTELANLLAGWMERMWGMMSRRPPVTRDVVATLTVDRGFSHTRANRELGYQPQVGIEEGLKRTLDWLQKTETSR
jgi:nucleoside-diphosphate-sugar epimerase